MEACTPQAVFAALQRNDPAGAMHLARQWLADHPADGETWFLLGVALRGQGDAAGAVESYRRALATHAHHADVWFNLGNALQDVGAGLEALKVYAEAVARDAGHRGALNQIMVLAPTLGQKLLAAQAATRLAELEPESLERIVALLRALRETSEWAKAKAAFEAALPRGTDNPSLLLEGAQILEHFGEYRTLTVLYQRLDGLLPNHPVVKFHLGLNRLRTNQNTSALAALRESEALGLTERALWVNLGTALARVDKVEEALVYLERAAPDYATDPSAFVFSFALKQKLCDWRGYDNLRQTLLDPAVAGLDASGSGYPALPFPFVTYPGEIDEGHHLAIARRFAAFVSRNISPYKAWPWAGSHQRIRLGYLSADFHDHATAHLMLGMFKRHDKRQFEVFAYSYGPEDGSDYRRRIREEVEHFVDLAPMSDADAAARIHADQIDLLVDLKGYTREARTGILVRRPAPVQIAWLGYPGTTGAEFIDYAVVDASVVPASQQRYFSERLLYMPGSYQANDDEQPIAGEAPARDEVGLPAKAVVFACFNAHYKIEPKVFAAWMRVLHGVPGSVLWLIDGYPTARQRLLERAAESGIAPARLIFSPRERKDRHLARHQCADLFLDTPACNAHTTMSDALWAGLPAISIPGPTFATRVGAGLLRAMGMDELVAPDLDAYVNLAIALGRDRQRLAGLRQTLLQRRHAAPLFDTAGFVRDLESRFTEAAPLSLQIRQRQSQEEMALKAAIDALGREDNAASAQILEAAVDAGCDRPDAWNAFAVAMRRVKRPEMAAFAYRRGLALKPDYADMMGNYANLLRDQDRLDEALPLYREAVRLAPGSLSALTNLASALSADGQPEAQLAVLEAAEKIDPVNPDTHWDKALALLMLGRVKEGLDEYEWRHARRNPPPRDYPRPQWQGEALAGKRIFLHWEQGYGDVIQFLRFLPLVAARGGKIVCEVQPGLKRLVEAVPGVVEVIEAPAPPPDFDVWASLLSVPRILGLDEASLPVARPYLHPREDWCLKWRQRLATPGGRAKKAGKSAKKRPCIGLVWAGNPNVKSDRLRSPRLEPLKALLTIKDVDWVLLQQGDGRRDLEGMSLPANVLDLASEIKDFADTAALMSELDLVISSDTSTAHLAAALGGETWVLLPWASDWRWGLGETSLWYPGVRLFRQSRLTDWSGVVDRVQAALKERFRVVLPKKHAVAATTAATDAAPALLVEAFGMYQRGRKRMARLVTRAALMEVPLRQDAWCLLGVVEKSLDDPVNAERAYRRAIEIAPDYVDAWFNLGNLMRNGKRLPDADAAYSRVVQIQPAHAQALSLLSDVQRELQRLDEAEATARRAIAAKPDFAEAWGHLGNALNDLERFDEAAECYQHALTLPNCPPETHYNKGVALQRARRVEESIVCYREILAQRPGEVYAHYNLATALLTLGQFGEGFREYEWRLKKPDLLPRPYPQPSWNGEPLGNRRLLLYWEQGYGDSLQFLRFIPLLAKQGARVILELQAGLKGIARHLPGVEAVFDSGEPLPAFDLHAPLLSVPARLGLDSPLPDVSPYLQVAPDLAERWRQRLGPRDGALRIGLVWAGNPNVRNDRVRSPRLAPMRALFDIPGIDWVILQQGDGRRDLEDLAPPGRIIDIAPEVSDFADTAAIMGCLDLMITSDTSTAHLAPAVGLPTWVLLHYAADWRWMQSEGTAWYPAIRVFRQPAPGDWAEPVERLRSALRERAVS